ncbi:hypothetical protein KLP40_13555 [Hymenobacter sp. NST-14]|uniref:hypothetical protein n=1 Tax=Hymenobacter piscis TaxID=2839984 RepID=UPI001C02B2B2|nr:hypothetical protein [Hymenobacter piscis]MBT9394193.1 hypothetical protein [Hymenobacter piscis]
MDNAATLAFFQNFYTEASLYVVAEPAGTVEAVAAAVSPAKAPPAPLPPAAPAVAPVAAAAVPAPPPVAPTPAPVAVPPAAPAPVATAPTVAPVVQPPAVSAPTAAPAATPAAAPTPATPAERAAVTLTLGQLPAAPAAPPSQPGRVQPTPTQSPVAHVPFSTLGSNAGGLVVLVRVSPDQFRKLPRNVFLNNLLKALRLIVEDVVLVNVEHPSYPVALCSLRRHLTARQFLAFGKNLLDVAVYTTQPYEPVLLYGDTAFLGAGEIEMLEYDAGRKKKLWQAVQRMFGV